MTAPTHDALSYTPNDVRPCPTRTQITLKARCAKTCEIDRPEIEYVQDVLQTLSNSLKATYRRLAFALDIPLTHVEIYVEAGLDLNGRASLADDIHTGLANIRIQAQLTSLTDICALEQLRIAVERHDPLINLLRQKTSTRLEVSLKFHNNQSLAA